MVVFFIGHKVLYSDLECPQKCLYIKYIIIIIIIVVDVVIVIILLLYHIMPLVVRL